MHYARLSRSPRQQRVLRVLSDGAEHSTLDIIRRAGVCAVSAIVSELRANGVAIACTRRKNLWFYRLGISHADD
ncbi:MAG TPA: hypothetical protein PKC22_09440 [Rhodocyclaceae bacterium]|nr:hypothetical protein [Rhodocyclaceae bacterium]